MKKTVSIMLLTVILLINVCFVGISADTSTSDLTKEEAHKLIWEGQLKYFKLSYTNEDFYITDILCYKGYYVILEKYKVSDNSKAELQKALVSEFDRNSTPDKRSPAWLSIDATTTIRPS